MDFTLVKQKTNLTGEPVPSNRHLWMVVAVDGDKPVLGYVIALAKYGQYEAVARLTGRPAGTSGAHSPYQAALSAVRRALTSPATEDGS